MAVDLDFAGPAVLARRVGGYGLPGHDEAEPLSIPAQAWPGLLYRLISEKLTGIAVAATEGGWLQLSPDQQAELFRCHQEAMAHALRLERMLLTLSEAFRRSGVNSVVLKGPALAHTCYPDPSWRSFADLDLMVRTEQWRTAVQVLDRYGFKRNLPEPRSGFDERFGKAVEFTSPEGLDLDFHRTLVLGPFGLWVNPNELFDRTVSFEVGGMSQQRLDDTGLLVHACIHASLGWNPPLLLPLRDVAQVPQAGKVDWAAVADTARRWRLTAVMHHALRTTSEAFGIHLPAEARPLTEVEPSRRDALALRAYTTDRRGRGGMELSMIRAIPGARAKAAFLRALLLPDREFLAARGLGARGRLSYLRRWRVPMRWLSSRRRGSS